MTFVQLFILKIHIQSEKLALYIKSEVIHVFFSTMNKIAPNGYYHIGIYSN